MTLSLKLSRLAAFAGVGLIWTAAACASPGGLTEVPSIGAEFVTPTTQSGIAELPTPSTAAPTPTYSSSPAPEETPSSQSAEATQPSSSVGIDLEVRTVQSPTPEPTATDTPTLSATTAPSPRPTDPPTATTEPMKEPTATPEPAEEPTATPEATEEPTATPEPTEAPTATPEPTEAPTATPEPTEAPTATPEPTEAPTATPEPTDVPDIRTDVRIVCILFDGEVPRSEADEYVEIANFGPALNLAGWVLKDRDDRNQEFTFPNYSLGSGETVRIYTNQIHSQWGGFSFGSGSSLWNNSEADTAVLLDSGGRLVSRATYDTGSPPGCGN